MNDGNLSIDPALLAQKSLADQTADFLLTLGDAHRDLWIRRLKKGMKPALKARFDGMVAAYIAETKENPA